MQENRWPCFSQQEWEDMANKMLRYPSHNFMMWDYLELDELTLYCERFYRNFNKFLNHHYFVENWKNAFKAAEYIQKFLSKKYVSIEPGIGLKQAIRKGAVMKLVYEKK